MEEKLQPALLYAFWIDSKNLTELTRPWYAKKLGVPLCFYYPGKYASHAKAVVESRVGEACDDVHQSAVESAIYREAEECLNILSRRLGDKDPYFFGKAPSSADAIMYGYLAPLLKAPLPNPTPLQTHIKACANLVSFVSRISLNYFPQTTLDYENSKKEPSTSKSLQEDRDFSDTDTNAGESEQKSLSEKLRPVMVGSFALTAMLGYAHLSGLLSVFKELDSSLIPNRIVDNGHSNDKSSD